MKSIASRFSRMTMTRMAYPHGDETDHENAQRDPAPRRD
jgi:hypothetical protein